jgi:DNA-binding XRE family transcriptional regulator
MSNQPLVYFFAKSNFGDTNPDFIKIGYTGTELSLRQAALQTGCESLIWAMGVLPFDTEDEARREERRIHDHFGGFRAFGEWFYATPRIIQYIEDYAVQPPTSGKEAIEPTRSEEAIAFGQWLKECRDQNNMTPDDVAQIVGCTAGYIRYIENGWGMPGRRLREALIALFGDPADSTTETIPDNPISKCH